MHTQLSVAVSPGLPALLINESYSCHLADLQGRFSPILVPAVEVVAGTQYTCNITGEVPSFNGSQAGTSQVSLCSHNSSLEDATELKFAPFCSS